MNTAFLLLVGFVVSSSADYAREALQTHNEFRRTHNAPPMRLNSQMSREASAYARKLVRMGRLKHSNKRTRPGQGENLGYRCATYGDILPAKQAVKNWYDEVCLYSFNNPGWSSAVGHFTQVVWKSSTELGIGMAKGKKGRMDCIYVVGRYKPGGNINTRKHFRENVLKGSFRSNYCNGVSAKDEPEKVEEENYVEEGRQDNEEKPEEE